MLIIWPNYAFLVFKISIIFTSKAEVRTLCILGMAQCHWLTVSVVDTLDSDCDWSNYARKCV